MIIPGHWAEARLQRRERGRRVTVRRFGWSDDSVEAAQAHAEARAREAMDRVLAGEALPRRERRVAYNGAEGVPIREEIVDRHGDSVITRNAYGALCLNTPDVLFADIDFAVEARPAHALASVALVFAAAGWLLLAFDMTLVATLPAALFLSLVLGLPLARATGRLWRALRGGDEQIALRRVRRFVDAHPDWRLAVYRTPAGLRLLALHRRFDPREEAVRACFDAVDVDRLYARMCFNQRCFRARVGPKPWRMGMPRLHPPYSAVWRPEHAALPGRREWIERYQEEAQGYAACCHLETIGAGPVDPGAETVRALHDLLCQSDRDLPLA